MSNLADYLDQFESQGATLSRPVLTEGNYEAHILELTSRTNKVVPSKGPNQGKEIVISNWGVKLALDSQTAQEVMKQDGDVVVYADQGTTNLGKGTLNLGDFGITFENNIAFWSFVGGIFSQVGLATKQQDDSGAATYLLDRNIINAIYNGIEEEKAKLENNSEVEPLLVSSKLAEIQLKNLSELIIAESETRKVYVHISRRSNYADKAKQEHFVKQIMLPTVFEEREDNVASVIR